MKEKMVAVEFDMEALARTIGLCVAPMIGKVIESHSEGNSPSETGEILHAACLEAADKAVDFFVDLMARHGIAAWIPTGKLN